MSKEFVFDLPHATRFVAARRAFLHELLPGLKESLSLTTALDAGCGVGHFCAFLRDLGFQVMGLDGRLLNVQEARRREPGIDFRALNIEDSVVQELGGFDLVLCFGLVYHLENPALAFRNLGYLTRKLLLVESICVPRAEAFFSLREEPDGEDQSLTSLALYPSEGSLLKLCFKVGFPFVYRFKALPDHEDFRETLARRRFRTVILASKVPISSARITRVAEPTDACDPWKRPWAGVMGLALRLNRFVRKPWGQKIEALRRHWRRV